MIKRHTRHNTIVHDRPMNDWIETLPNQAESKKSVYNWRLIGAIATTAVLLGGALVLRSGNDDPFTHGQPPVITHKFRTHSTNPGTIDTSVVVSPNTEPMTCHVVTESGDTYLAIAGHFEPSDPQPLAAAMQQANGYPTEQIPVGVSLTVPGEDC